MTVVYDSTPLFPVRKIFPKHQRVEYFNCQIYEKKQQTKHPYKFPNSAVMHRWVVFRRLLLTFPLASNSFRLTLVVIGLSRTTQSDIPHFNGGTAQRSGSGQTLSPPRRGQKFYSADNVRKTWSEPLPVPPPGNADEENRLAHTKYYANTC